MVFEDREICSGESVNGEAFLVGHNYVDSYKVCLSTDGWRGR